MDTYTAIVELKTNRTSFLSGHITPWNQRRKDM